MGRVSETRGVAKQWLVPPFFINFSSIIYGKEIDHIDKIHQ